MSCEELAENIMGKLYAYVRLERDYFAGVVEIGDYSKKRAMLRDGLVRDLKKSTVACKPK